MLLTELKEIDYKKEKEGAIEIVFETDVRLDEIQRHRLKTNNELLDGKYYLSDTLQICYYKNGNVNRENNLPAIIFKDVEAMFYCINGLAHRMDGPASIYAKDNYKWGINGYCIEKEQMNNWLNENNIPQDWNTWTESDKFYFSLHWSDYNGE